MITCLFILYGGFIMTGNSCKGRSDNQFIHLRREMDKSGYKCCPNLWGCNGYRTKESHWPDVLQSDLCKNSEISVQVRMCCVAFSCLITEVMASYCRHLQSTSVTISFRDGPNDYFHGWLLSFVHLYLVFRISGPFGPMDIPWLAGFIYDMQGTNISSQVIERSRVA